MQEFENDKINNSEEAFDFLMQQKADNDLKNRIKSQGKIREMKPSWNGARMLRIAASVIILAGAAYLIAPSGNISSMANNMLDGTPLVMMEDLDTRGVITDKDSLILVDAQEAIKKGDFKTAISVYEEKKDINALNWSDKYYYAWSLIKTDGDLNIALKLLDDIIESSSPLEKEALWLKSIVFIKLDKLPQAEETLNRLKERSTYQMKNVEKLLKKIK